MTGQTEAGPVLGEEVGQRLADALALDEDSGHWHNTFDVVAALVAQARADGAQAERERIETEAGPGVEPRLSVDDALRGLLAAARADGARAERERIELWLRTLAEQTDRHGPGLRDLGADLRWAANRLAEESSPPSIGA